MDKHVVPKKKRTLPALTVAIAVMSTMFIACEQASSARTPVAASAASLADASQSRSKQEAMAALMALPELKAWSAQIEKSSGGKLRGALMEYDAAPKVVGGKTYFQFSFVENGSDAARNWESFLVADRGGEILVDDSAGDKPLTLAEWRRDKKPMEQLGAR